MTAQRARVAACLLVLTGAISSATPLLLTTGGTISDDTPASILTTPGEAWTLSIQLDSNPAVSAVSLGSQFSAAFSNFTYTLNGSVVATPPVTQLIFWTTGLGGFDFCFAGPCSPGMEIIGPQLYSGPESAPTILTGVYQTTNVNALFVDFEIGQSSFLPITITDATATPEPSTILLSGAALLLVGALRLRTGSPPYR